MFSSHHGSHSNELALEYFDFAYPLIFHRHWPSIRLALLSLPKPVAILNPYSLSHNDVKTKLIQQGAIDLLRFDNDELQKHSAQVQEQIAFSDSEYAAKRLLEQQERRRLLGTTDLNDEKEEIIDEDNDLNSFNQPEPVQSMDELYKKALQQQVGKKNSPKYFQNRIISPSRSNPSLKEMLYRLLKNNLNVIIEKFHHLGMFTHFHEAM